MQDLTSKEHIDRLPFQVSGKNTTQLLDISKLESGTGVNMANAVVKAIEK